MQGKERRDGLDDKDRGQSAEDEDDIDCERVAAANEAHDGADEDGREQQLDQESDGVQR